MGKPRKLKVELPPDVYEWLASAAHDRQVLHMTPERMLVRVLESAVFAAQHAPEEALDPDGSGMRICCYTPPMTSHRGTCRHSAERGGADYARLQATWRAQ